MEGQSPLTEQEILNIYFLENRARLLDIASFLDRLDRAQDAGGTPSDFRHQAFLRAVELLLEPGAKRTRDIQMSFSDHSHQPIASAVGLKAVGAWDGGES